MLIVANVRDFFLVSCFNNRYPCSELSLAAELLVPGDGTGIGKGRQIAGLIQENCLKGRKRALWISSSADLNVDAEKDLLAVRCGLEVVSTTTKGWDVDRKHCVVFCTYTALVGRKNQEEYGAEEVNVESEDEEESQSENNAEQDDEIDSEENDKEPSFKKLKMKHVKIHFKKAPSKTVQKIESFFEVDFDGVVSCTSGNPCRCNSTIVFHCLLRLRSTNHIRLKIYQEKSRLQQPKLSITCRGFFQKPVYYMFRRQELQMSLI